VHEHCGSVALLGSKLAMLSCGSGRRGVAVFRWEFGLAQADTQVFHQLRKMLNALRIADLETVKVAAFFRSHQPSCDDAGAVPREYVAYALFDRWRLVIRSTVNARLVSGEAM
jgi:hypothetical protein